MRYKEIERLDLQDNNLKEIVKNKEYLQIYSLYRKYLTEYVLLETRLQEYDNKIKNNELYFSIANENDMDFYQLFSLEELNYFYIRNDLYMEQLNKEEVNELLERINSKNYEFDEKAQQFIKKTYKKILRDLDNDIVSESSLVRNEVYGGFLVAEGTLVLGMKFNEFAEEQISGEPWLEIYEKRIEFIKSIFKEIKTELEEKLDIPVEIIKF